MIHTRAENLKHELTCLAVNFVCEKSSVKSIPQKVVLVSHLNSAVLRLA